MNEHRTTSGVSAEDVIASIEMILGFTPDTALVDYHLGLGFPDRHALGKYMMSTDACRRAQGWHHHNNSIFLGDRVYARTYRGERIFLVPTDVDLTPSLLDGAQFEPYVERALAAVVRPGDTGIDIGCNIGYHTLSMAQRVGPNGKLFAFEANPEVYKLLHATLVVNGFTDFRAKGRVELFNEAVADKNGSLTLAYVESHFGSGNLVTDDPTSDFGAEYNKRVQVPVVALDEKLSHLPKIDFLHMDIEGAEPLALRGASGLLERSPDIRIITEWANHMMATITNVPEHISWLGNQGFRFWLIPEQGGFQALAQEDMINLPHCDILMSRRETPAG